MAVYDSLNMSTFNFKSILNYAEFSIHEQKADPFTDSSESLQSIEFQPIFPICPFDIPSISCNQLQPLKETKQVPERSLYVDFRVPSEWRDYRVTAHDQAGSAIFYINLEEIFMISKVLFQKITTVTRTRNGQMYGAGEFTVGIWEFDVLLRLICNSYEGVARSTAIVPSEWRDYRVTAHDQAGSAIFYINLEEIFMISKVLFQKITTVTRTRNGQMYGAGEFTVGIWEFDVLLRLICNSYEGVARSTAIAKYMKGMLVLAARYDIPSLIEECKMVVLNANFSNVDTVFVQRWFEAFEDTKLDEIRNNHGNVISKSIRSHIISEMSRLNRWHELFQFIPQNYSAPIRYRMQFGQKIFSTYEVDHLILGFKTFSGNGGSSHQVSPVAHPYYY